LTHWTQYNYGYGAIFIRYLIDRFGDTAIKNMCDTNRVGIAAVESATGTDFNTLFNDFTRALVMSGTGDSNDPKYRFTTLNLQTLTGQRGLTTTLSFSAGSYKYGSIYPYGIYFTKCSGNFNTLYAYDYGIVGTAFGLSQ
jgi:hypothetical protein